jgi:hypothetical protein
MHALSDHHYHTIPYTLVYGNLSIDPHYFEDKSKLLHSLIPLFSQVWMQLACSLLDRMNHAFFVLLQC